MLNFLRVGTRKKEALMPKSETHLRESQLSRVKTLFSLSANHNRVHKLANTTYSFINNIVGGENSRNYR